MAKKLLDLSSTGLGDLDSIFHNQGVADLSWLSVDRRDYDELSSIPKQNLDIIPELQKALVNDKSDGNVPKLIPLRPHTIVNRNPLDSDPQVQRDFSAPIKNRVSKFVMAGLSNNDVINKLKLEFPESVIRHNRDAISSIISERGLLGNVYVDASHFPNISSDMKERKLVNTLSKKASFVLNGCGGKNACLCVKTGFCSVFGGKKVVSDIPYSAKLAISYSESLSKTGKNLDLSNPKNVDGSGWKERIRSAFLQSPNLNKFSDHKTVIHQKKPSKPKISEDDISSFVERSKTAKVSLPDSLYMKFARRMMNGIDDTQILNSHSNPELRKLSSERGILGHVYIDVDALGGCKNTLSFLKKNHITPETNKASFLRRNSSCFSCNDSCSCLTEFGPILSSKPSVGPSDLDKALTRALADKRITGSQFELAKSKTSSNRDQNWRNLTSRVNLLVPLEKRAVDYSSSQTKAFYGSRVESSDSNLSLDPIKVRKTISHLMNTGLSGGKLKKAVLSIFSRSSLSQFPEVGAKLAREDGIQGTYFIDPTPYPDYGRGCGMGSKQFRKRGALNVLASGSCTGCTLQTAPGWCSKYSKTLIRTVPESVRSQVASSRKHLPIVASTNIRDISQEYGLSSEMSVDISGPKLGSLDISINSVDIDC